MQDLALYIYKVLIIMILMTNLHGNGIDIIHPKLVKITPL